LPSSHVGWTGNAPRELVGRVKLLVLDELAEALCALLIVIEFEETELGRADCGTNKFVDLALIFWVKEELSVLADVLLELFLKLNDVLEDELFLRRILAIAD